MQSPLLQLLAAAADARRRLEVQVADAEAVLAQREAELADAQARLQAMEPRLDELQARVAAGAARVVQADGTLSALALAEAVAKAAVKLATTPVGYPPPPGHTAKDEVARVEQARAEVGRAREQVVAALAEARHGVQEGSQAVADGRRLVATLSEEIEQRRNALASLRQQLEDAVAAGKAAEASTGNVLTAESGQAAKPGSVAVADIPAPYLDLYQRQALTCPGLSWTVLAAIGSIESSHGRSNAAGVHSGANSAGAMGPMQFLAPTWAAYSVDGSGDGVRDVYEPADAIAGAAAYLCASGGGQLATLAPAIWNYNHADWYVASVIQLATAYGGGQLDPPAGPVDPAALVGNPNLTLSPQARADILGGVADQRVLGLLSAAAAQHRITVSVVKTGHDKYVHNTDRVSNHYACDGCQGRGLDITEVDGGAVVASNDAALELALSILTTEGSLRPDEFGSPWPELSRFPGGFTDDDHQDHLHVGWRA